MTRKRVGIFVALAILCATAIAYASGGFIYLSGPIGDQGTFAVQGQSAPVFPTDANHTATQAEYAGGVLYVTSTGSLTATRKLILPLYAGEVKDVYNFTTGGQAIIVGGVTGNPTGEIANGSVARVLSADGIDYLSISGGGSSFPYGTDISDAGQVIGFRGKALTDAAPGVSATYIFDGATWAPIVQSGDCTRDATGVVTCAKINGTSVPAGGSLTTGNACYVSSSAACTYGPLNLAGGVNYVTGALPSANQAAQSLGGDLGGTTTAGTVTQITGPPANAQMSVTAGSFDWTPGGIANFDVFRTPYSLTTANATPAVLATIATSTGYCYRFDIIVQTRLATADFLSNSHSATYCNVSGTPTLSNTGVLNGQAQGTATGLTWTGVTFAVSGTSIQIKITGPSSPSVTWLGDLRITRTT